MVTIVALLAVLAASALALQLFYRAGVTRERAWRQKETAWEKERKDLLDRIMFLAGHPWEMPEPAEAPVAEVEYDPDALDMPIEHIDETFEYPAPVMRV